MTFPIPFSGCGINKVFVSMSGCSGGCAGACGHRTGISHDSSQQWEGFGSHCQQLQSPQATGRVVESQPGRMNRRGERGRAEDGVAHGSLSTARESCGAQILWRILWGIPVGLPHIPITHSQQVALLSSPDCHVPVDLGMSTPSLPRSTTGDCVSSVFYLILFPAGPATQPPQPLRAISCPQATDHSLHSGGVQTARVPPWDLTQPLLC